MKFISLAVIALLSTSEAVNLRSKDMEADDAAPADAQLAAAEGGEAATASGIAEEAAAAGVDPAVLAQA